MSRLDEKQVAALGGAPKEPGDSSDTSNRWILSQFLYVYVVANK